MNTETVDQGLLLQPVQGLVSVSLNGSDAMRIEMKGEPLVMAAVTVSVYVLGEPITIGDINRDASLMFELVSWSPDTQEAAFRKK